MATADTVTDMREDDGVKLSDDWEEQARRLLQDVAPRTIPVWIWGPLLAAAVVAAVLTLSWSVWVSFGLWTAALVLMLRVTRHWNTVQTRSTVDMWIRNRRAASDAEPMPPWPRWR